MLCGVKGDSLMTWGNGLWMRGARGSEHGIEEADLFLYSLILFSRLRGCLLYGFS